MKKYALFGFVTVLLAGVFFAQEKNQFQPPADVEFLRDVEFGKGGGRALRMDIAMPKGEIKNPLPAIVFVHGGGWRAGNRDAGIRPIIGVAHAGYVGATIEYRLSQEAKFPAQIEDCKCAIRFLRAHAADYHLDPDHIGVWGTSAGGHLVALLGTTADVKDLEGSGGWEKYSSRVQAVCDWFGPTNFLTMLKPQSAGTSSSAENPVAQLLGGAVSENIDKAKRASPINYVSKDSAPTLIMHGDKDPLVPLAQSEEFEAALKKAGVEVKLEVIQGAGHGGPGFGTESVRKEVLEFFDKHLKTAAK